MSFVIAVPEFVASAATDLSNIGSGLSAANAAAVAPTTAVVAAAGDEVSAAIASLFSGHAKEFQALGALITPNTPCSTVPNGEALAASVNEYAPPAPLKARTNSA